MIDNMTFTQFEDESSTSENSKFTRERLLVKKNFIGIQVKSFLSVVEEQLTFIDLTFQDCPEEE